MKFATLNNWALSGNEKLKYYLGTANYKTSFEVDSLPETQELLISLEKVGVMAKVMVNSMDIGTTWIAPYRLDVTKCLKEGKNTIEIEVVNLWRNRLLKDRQLPKDERYTWRLVDDIKDGEEPHTSGLIETVRIEYY